MSITTDRFKTAATRVHLATERARAKEDVGQTARAMIRAGLHDERVWLGETSDEAERYRARHARWDAAPVTVGQEAGA